MTASSDLAGPVRLRWEVGVASHQGHVRPGNEDAAGFRRLGRSGAVIGAVADGMTRLAGGEIASQVAVDTLVVHLASRPLPAEGEARLDVLAAGLEAAHAAIEARSAADSSLHGMGTTAMAVLLTRDGVACQYAGDTRLYWLRGGEVLRVTRDHTAVQVLVDLGRVRPEDAVHHALAATLTSWLGAGASWGSTEVGPGADAVMAAQPGDVVVLATDGVYVELSAPEIARIACAPGFARRRAERLVQAVLQTQARDNATVLVAVARRMPGDRGVGAGPVAGVVA